MKHVIWVWMENHTAGSVFGAPDAPTANRLRGQCGSSATYQSVGSPSLPNYLGATSGDTSGIADDAPPSDHALTSDNLFRQTRAAGLTSRSYEEGMTSPCQLSDSGRYAVRHNPAAYYVGEQDRAACLRDDVTLGDPTGGPLADDLAHDTLPAFSFITPDLCHDTHDCPVADGDQWLTQWLPFLLDSTAYRGGTTIVFVVWDEPTPMPLLVIAAHVPPGTVTVEPFDHYSLLRTTEELLGLPLLGQAARAQTMRTAFSL
ncbi:MAG: phosphatidylinositol-3-phosphatase [Acidimicrobiaceae bacterium]